MRAILGQTIAALAAIALAAWAFADTKLNLWPVYAVAAAAGAFGWVAFWELVRRGRGFTVRPSCPDQPKPGHR